MIKKVLAALMILLAVLFLGQFLMHLTAKSEGAAKESQRLQSTKDMEPKPVPELTQESLELVKTVEEATKEEAAEEIEQEVIDDTLGLPASWPVEIILAPGSNQELRSSIYPMPNSCTEIIEPPYDKYNPDHLEMFVCGDPFEAAGPNSNLTVLAGHSSSIIDFKLNFLSEINLDSLVGKDVILTTEAGHQLVYGIDGIYTPEQEEAPYMPEIWAREPGKLVIVTCQLADNGFRIYNTSKNIFIVAHFKSIAE